MASTARLLRRTTITTTAAAVMTKPTFGLLAAAIFTQMTMAQTDSTSSSSMPTSMSSSTTMASDASSTMDSSMSGAMPSSMQSSMPMSRMEMTFTATTGTPLYSTGWMPTSAGAYAGTCIFLIILAAFYRCLFAIKKRMESQWTDRAWNRRYVVVADKQPESEKARADPDLKTAVLTANGVEESVKVVHRPVRGVQPWRFSVDLPRAAMVTLMVGNGYLLMLAVMTMNVGYFLSILAGTFFGELVIGRFSQVAEEHH